MEQENQYAMQLLIYHSALWFCVVKGYHRYRSISFIPWSTRWNIQWGPVKN